MSLRDTITKAVEGSPDEPQGELQRYLDTISTYEREFKKWEGRTEKILKRYRDENRDKTQSSAAKFNVLWSNVQTLVPACFSRIPQPDVSRRFRDNDPVGRVAALILERALEFEVQHYADYRTTMKQSVYDRFLGGRGTSWARYEPHFKPFPQITEDVQDEEVNEQLDYECAPTDYVHWKDFGHSIARSWEEVTIVWRKVYMSEAAVLKRFGEDLAKQIPYDASPDDRKTKSEDNLAKKQALVYELWDKEESKAVWINKSVKQFLDEKEDPLGLQDFFPCPRPLYATITNDTLVPVPDFTLYQDQANELDTLADRIDGLIKMLQVKGVYDGSADAAVARLFTEGNNGTLLPVKNWAAFSEKQGLKGAIDVYDISILASALEIAQNTFEQVKDQVYEITGISDIIRGQTKASETATAQQMKGQYASLRLKNMQLDVAAYATYILQLKAQIMCAKFSPQTIAKMAAVDQLSEDDKQYIQPALALLVGEERLQDPEAEAPNPLRSFRIEVAADTMVELDEQSEKQDRMEMITAMGGYFKNVLEIAGQAPPLIPLIVEIAKFGITAFKVGKTIEGTFDQALDQLKQQAANPKPQPPDPQIVKAQMDAQSKQAQLQAQQQSEQGRLQHDAAVAQMEHDRDVARINAEKEARLQEQQAQALLEQQRLQQEHETERLRLQVEDTRQRWVEELKARTQIEVAEIAAQSALDAQEAKAASEASKDQRVEESKAEDRKTALKVAEMGAKKQEQEKEPQPKAEAPKLPDIHVHLPSGNKKITKTKDGYESKDLA